MHLKTRNAICMTRNYFSTNLMDIPWSHKNNGYKKSMIKKQVLSKAI